MLKKNSKLLVVLFVILTIVSSFTLSFADEAVTTSENNTPEVTTTNEENSEDIYEGDLYLAQNHVTMDKLVDGNVYILGNDVTISGQVNGNLYVLANSVKFDNCYVRYSIYACANNIYYNGACNDLYVSTGKLEMTYDSYVVRDVKAMADSTILKAAIGRDVDLKTGSVDFGSDKEVPIIYGNLRYSANHEMTLADGIVEGEVNYTSNGSNILSISLLFVTAIVTVLVVYALVNKFNPNYVKNFKFSGIDIFKALGIGILTMVVGAILSVVLFFTVVGAKLGLIVLAILALLKFFAVPAFTILMANFLNKLLNLDKKVMYYLILALVAIVICGLSLIPFYVGTAIYTIVTITGFGLIVSSFLPKKELTEEELAKRAEAAKEKAEKKAEKKALNAEKKAAKKAEKAQAKEAKKSNK